MKKYYVITFLISMVPVVELRGAIPYAAYHDLPFGWAYALSVLGNMLPVPLILWFVPAVFAFMRRHGILIKMVDWLENKAQKGAKKIEKYTVFGLFLFVAIPLPGTGAWTGSLAASIFGMKKSWALISVFLGVLAAGVIMTLASYGVVGALRFFAK